MEDGLLRITAVTLDGVEFANFDALTRTLNIAAGEGGKFKVTFESVVNTNAVETSPQQDQISVFPNPTRGLIKVEGMSDVSKISVVDLTGKVLLEEKIQRNANHSFDLSNLSPGIYFFVLQKNSGLKIIKKVIKH